MNLLKLELLVYKFRGAGNAAFQSISLFLCLDGIVREHDSATGAAIMIAHFANSAWRVR